LRWEGALAGIDAGLDVFGLLVLSFVTALGGGPIRDLLIGAIPPNSILFSSAVSEGADPFDDYA
jgi:uncharacterized membrane protein YeiH